MRLIDADALEKIITEKFKEHYGNTVYQFIRDFFTFVIRQIRKAPTIEAEPVKHGWWVIITDEFDCEMMECSCCGAEFYDGDNDTVDCLHNYCPNCGADMRERRDGECDLIKR